MRSSCCSLGSVSLRPRYNREVVKLGYFRIFGSSVQHLSLSQEKSKTVQEITESASEPNNAYMVPRATGLLVLLLDLALIKLSALNPDFHRVFFSRVYTNRLYISCCNSNRQVLQNARYEITRRELKVQLMPTMYWHSFSYAEGQLECFMNMDRNLFL